MSELAQVAGSLTIDEARLERELRHLAAVTDAPQPPEGVAVTRVLFTARDLEARTWLKTLAHAEGLSVREDAVGNIFVRLEGTEPATGGGHRLAYRCHPACRHV